MRRRCGKIHIFNVSSGTPSLEFAVFSSNMPSSGDLDIISWISYHLSTLSVAILLQVVPSPLASHLSSHYNANAASNITNDGWNNSGNDSPYSSTSLANNSSIGQLYRISEITPADQHEGGGGLGYYRDSLDAGASSSNISNHGSQAYGAGCSSPLAPGDAGSPGGPKLSPSSVSSAGTPTATEAKDIRLAMLQRRISSNAFGAAHAASPSSQVRYLMHCWCKVFTLSLYLALTWNLLMYCTINKSNILNNSTTTRCYTRDVPKQCDCEFCEMSEVERYFSAFWSFAWSNLTWWYAPSQTADFKESFLKENNFEWFLLSPNYFHLTLCDVLI